MKKCLMWFCLALFVKTSFAQVIQSPSEYLGHQPGEKFTPHHKVLEYFKYLSSTSKNTKLQEYGKTYEGRPLVLAFISSERNIDNLENIRESNLRLSGMKSGVAGKKPPVVIWLSYNVHGDEAVSSEAALQTAFDLLSPQNSKNKSWLENTVVIIDPCMNPDGRERYVNFYNSVKNSVPDASPFTREHIEPWPGGRTNHYYFDLNRDWAWQTQVETRHRMVVYNQWLPQVHVDFHEQGINAPYYFAPAAEPLHEDVTKWQREFQAIIGKNNARYFDQKGWLYFTKERFDLLYPSYGDTYPTYNGAIGMTYEQAGSGEAGLAVLTETGDTLTLKDRIEHHFTAGLSTIEATSANADKVISEYQKYFANSRTNPSGPYKSYVIKDDGSGKLKVLADLLSRNGIECGFGISRAVSGYDYQSLKTANFQIANSDMVISAYQPKSVLVKVLFEPQTHISDSVTYDITAWALPYAFGLRAYATKEVIKPAPRTGDTENEQQNQSTLSPVAYMANWGSVADARFLARLLRNNIKVRYSEVPMEVSGNKFKVGSLIITRTGNERLDNNFENTVKSIARASAVKIEPLQTGFVEKGADLGSDRIRYIKKPKVALVYGDETSPLAFGEVWHFFEQEVNYPLSIIRSQDVKHIGLDEFDIIIYPNGSYTDIGNDRIHSWIQNGGKLIALENSVAQLAGKKGFNLTGKEENKGDKDKNPYANIKKYANREREGLSNSIPGAIYRVDMDGSHPLGFGLSDYYTLKRDAKVYNFLSNGWNVGVLKKNNYVTGFVGNHAKKVLEDTMVFGVQQIGNGSVVYLTEDPLFRGFWENGKLLFSNAVFMVGN